MIHPRVVTFLSACLMLAPLAALAAPDCGAASTQADLNGCAAKDLAGADRELNRVYKQLSQKLIEPAARKQLVDAERAWIAYRDKECAFEASGVAGGSIQSMVIADCIADKTRAHTTELNRLLTCAEGDTTCPAINR